MRAWLVIKKRKWLLVPLSLLLLGLVALLAALLRDVARQVLDWLIVAYQVTSLYVQTLPQPIIWTLFVAFALAILAGSLFGWQSRPRAARQESRTRPGPVGQWARITGRAFERSSLRPYYRWRLARELSSLTVEALAHTRRVSLVEARRLLDSGEFEAPAEVRAYLLAGRADPPDQPFPLLRHLLGRDKTSPLELDPEQVVAFLERELEVRGES